MVVAPFRSTPAQPGPVSTISRPHSSITSPPTINFRIASTARSRTTHRSRSPVAATTARSVIATTTVPPGVRTPPWPSIREIRTSRTVAATWAPFRATIMGDARSATSRSDCATTTGGRPAMCRSDSNGHFRCSSRRTIRRRSTSRRSMSGGRVPKARAGKKSRPTSPRTIRRRSCAPVARSTVR